MKARRALGIGVLAVVLVSGCNQPEEQFGRTWYLDGAGNWGFGVSEMVYGLRGAGYNGQVSAFLWSMTMSPVADQILKLSGPGAARLAGCIDDYHRRHPGNEVNVVALSAGADVALRAVKHVTPPNKVDNIILLAPSVSCRYAVGPVLKNMRGKIYVYYSSQDGMLAGPVRVLGSFGGKMGDEPAGLVGLHSPDGAGRIVNVAWSPRFASYGWNGSHTSVTSERFVQQVLSKHIVTDSTFDIAVARAYRAPSDGAKPSAKPPDEQVASAAKKPVKIGSAGKQPGQRSRQGTARRREPGPADSIVVRPTKPGSRATKVAAKSPKQSRPRPAVFAPPLGGALSQAVRSPMVRPGQPATFITLSRRDPRFPIRSNLAGGLRLRLIAVPGSTSARIEIRSPQAGAPTVKNMAVETGQRCRGANGRSWAISLLRVDPPSQTAWVRIRPIGEQHRRASKNGNGHPPTT